MADDRWEAHASPAFAALKPSGKRVLRVIERECGGGATAISICALHGKRHGQACGLLRRQAMRAFGLRQRQRSTLARTARTCSRWWITGAALMPSRRSGGWRKHVNRSRRAWQH